MSSDVFGGASSRKLYGVGIFRSLMTRSSSVRRPAIKSWNPSCYILSCDSSTIGTDDVYFWAKQCTRLRRKFLCLKVFTGHGKAVKSKKFICHAWIVMELDWSPWKLLVHENSVLEIRYCRCQSKEIASMIEMSTHGTNFIEKQSLCLFNWSMLKRKPITKGKFWKKFTVTASKVIEKVLTFEELKRVQECCELSIWQMTVKLKVIDIRPCLPGVINASVSEYSSIIFFIYKCTMALLGDRPPNLLNWSTWLSVKRPPFSMAALRTNLVAKPCKRQKVALEPFNQGTNYTLLDTDCVLTAKIGKSFKIEFQLWPVWIEVHISHFPFFQVNDCGIFKGTQFIDLCLHRKSLCRSAMAIGIYSHV